MNTKNAKLYIDDTGKVDEGAYTEVTATIETDDTSELETTQERCRGEDFTTESAGHQTLQLTGTLKFALSSTLLQRFVTAHNTKAQIGILVLTGPNNVEGHQGWEFNALIKSLGRPMPEGDFVKYTFTAVPHADNTDSNVPAMYTVPAA